VIGQVVSAAGWGRKATDISRQPGCLMRVPGCCYFVLGAELVFFSPVHALPGKVVDASGRKETSAIID